MSEALAIAEREAEALLRLASLSSAPEYLRASLAQAVAQTELLVEIRDLLAKQARTEPAPKARK